MKEKKPYTSPKIYQVELNQDQAILTACQAGVASASTGSNRRCTSTCRRANSGGAQAARPS